MSKYCPKCGTAVPDDAKFCPKCGYQFQPVSAEGHAASQPAMSVSSASASSAAQQPAEVEPTHAAEQSASPASGQPTKAKIVTKAAKTDNKHSHGKRTKWILAAIIAIVLVIFGYRQFYVPHVVESAVESNHFTSAKGYTTAANLNKHQLVIYANSTAQQTIAHELAANEFDTRRITAENNLSDLAHDLAGKTLGKWQIILAVKDSQGTASQMWKYTGTKETHRFQTSSAGRQLRQSYLEKQQEEAQQAQEEDNEEKIGAGLLGGGIGLILGGL